LVSILSPALAAFEEIVEKHGVIACISAGNAGPGLNTVKNYLIVF
jgi:hypothetical protein